MAAEVVLDDVVHGTNSSYDAGCHCDTCRASNTARAAWRAKRRYLGVLGPSDLVDATRAQEWVQYLRSRGMTLDQIAERAEICLSTVKRISGPVRAATQIRVITAAKILAVKPLTSPLSRGPRVDAQLTWRRLRSLMALGYTQSWLAAQIGRPTSTRGVLHVGKNTVRAETARLIADLCERVGETPGPSKFTRSWAANRGYLPPQYYDDDFRILSL